MNNISRTDFLKICSGLLLSPLTGIATGVKIKTPLLSFSTLGCPDWDIDQIINFAVKHKYDGVEIRGIQRELYLPRSVHFNSPAAIAEIKEKFRKRGIDIVGLGCSSELHHRDAVKRKISLDEAKHFIDLASKLDCPYIRVFPNSFPPGQERAETFELISNGLTELGNYGEPANVRVLMETHGDLVQSADIEKVMQSVKSKNTGLVWDIANMWAETKEEPSIVYNKLKKYIFHAHIKDLSIVNKKYEYKFIGRGEVPVFKSIDLLIRDNYKGYFSFEWEKLWHPEIGAPELAFADYAKVMRERYK